MQNDGIRYNKNVATEKQKNLTKKCQASVENDVEIYQ